MSLAPAVSVLLPVRDAAPWLAKALASLEQQTFADFEICLQDDGSSDGSPELAAAWAQRDPRLYVEIQAPRGIVSALNAAAARARGALLVRMDADDVSTPDRLARLVEAARDVPDAAFFASAVRYFPREAVSEGMRRYEDWINGAHTHEQILANRFVECPMPHPAWALRRDAFRALGGYREGPWPEDYELLLRAAEAGVRFHKVEEVLLHWREGGHRLSKTDARYTLEAFFELKAAYLSRYIAGRTVRVVVAGAGRAGKRWARRLQEDGHEVAAFLDARPARIGQRHEGVTVHPYGDAASFEDAVILVTTGQRGGRAAIVDMLSGQGLQEGRDVFCVQ